MAAGERLLALAVALPLLVGIFGLGFATAGMLICDTRFRRDFTRFWRKSL